MKNVSTVIALAAAVASLLGSNAFAQIPPSPVDPYPGATMLPEGTIATVAQAPAINSRIGPGATPRGVGFPVAGQLLQGTQWRATQSAPATKAPACSRGWIQLFALQAGQEVVPGNRDVWVCRGDGGASYVILSAAGGMAAAMQSPQGSPASQGSAASQGSQASPTPAAPATAAPPSPATSPASRASPPSSRAPVAPGPVIAAANSADTVTLNWNPPADPAITGYRIERCAGQGCNNFREVASVARPPFADSGLAPQTTYAYRLRAFDPAGQNSEYTAVAIATTQPPTQSLPDLAVSDLKSPPSGSVGARIDVTATVVNKGATPASRYRTGFYFSDDKVTTFSGTYCDMPALPAGASGPCRGTVAVPATLAPGTYWIVAVADDLTQVSEKDESNNSGGVRITLAAAPAVTSATIPPPAALTANPAGPASIRLAWGAPPKGAAGAATVAGYKIERCIGSGCTGFAQIATSTSNAHTDPGVVAGTTYVYRVRAVDSAGGSSNYSNTAAAVVRPVAGNIPYERVTQ